MAAEYEGWFVTNEFDADGTTADNVEATTGSDFSKLLCKLVSRARMGHPLALPAFETTRLNCASVSASAGKQVKCLLLKSAKDRMFF